MKKIVMVITLCMMAFVGCANALPQESLPEVETNTGEEQLAVPSASTETEQPEENQSISEPSEEQGDVVELPDGRAFFDMFDEPAVLLQFEPIAEGEELVVLHTNHGDITLRLFPEEAPLSVENFLTHARNGYYDGVIFHRIIENFMIQGGDPDGTGMGGESIWGEPFFVKWMVWQLFGETFPEEIRLELPSVRLKHFRGALAMARAGGSMGSQFYIVHNPFPHPGIPSQIDSIIGELSAFGEVPDGFIETMQEVAALYQVHGGTPHLDWWWEFGPAHVVFGHVVEGMDIIDAIAEVAVDQNSRPFDDVYIESISFITYGEM